MLDNEPKGGDPSGTEAAPTAPDGTTAVRRTRTTRRRTADAETDAPAQPSGITGDEPVKKATRRRRKATEADESGASGSETPDAAGSANVAEAAEAAPRTRRRTKAAASAEQPSGAEVEGGASDAGRGGPLKPTSLLFMAPEATEPAPRRRTETRAEPAEAGETGTGRRVRRRGGRPAAPPGSGQLDIGQHGVGRLGLGHR